MLISYAIFSYFVPSKKDKPDQLEEPVHDGMTQAQYMHQVRIRYQESLMALYGASRYGNKRPPHVHTYSLPTDPQSSTNNRGGHSTQRSLDPVDLAEV